MLPARDGGRACALRLRPDDLHPAPEGGARRARARPHRRPPSPPLAHPPRPRGRGRGARPPEPVAAGARVGGRRAARDRPDEARRERTPPLRQRLRRPLGRARTRSRRERPRRRRPRPRPRVLPDARTCVASRVVPRRRRDALCGRRRRSAARRRVVRHAARALRPSSTSRPGSARSSRSSAAHPPGWR